MHGIKGRLVHPTFLFFFFFLISILTVNSQTLSDFYHSSSVSSTFEGCGGSTVKDPDDEIMDDVILQNDYYCDRAGSYIRIVFTEPISFVNGTFKVHVPDCANYGWEKYTAYYETEVQTIPLSTFENQSSECNTTTLTQTIYFEDVTTDVLGFIVNLTTSSQDWGYGVFYYNGIREFNVSTFTATFNTTGDTGNLTSVTDGSRTYLTGVEDGVSKFNSIFYLVLFIAFIWFMFVTRDIKLSLIVTGICGILATWFLTGNVTQLITSATILGLGITLLITGGIN